MARIALISCTSSKKEYMCEARELYSESPRFRLAYSFAKSIADEVFILSAKHGLIAEDAVIEPYNESLKDKTTQERRQWAENVLADLKLISDFENDELIIIAGTAYNEYLMPHFKNYWLPLKGKLLGEWIPKLNRLLLLEEESDSCRALHILFNGLSRLDWTRIGELTYKNGIYIMFEKNQHYHGMDRIVRVGTHRGQDRLIQRLKDHFMKEDANGSIFRKNIGRVMLHAVGDPYIDIWELDTSKIEVREKNGHLIDETKEAELEKKISTYMKENITFVCFPVESEEERLRLEEGIISLLNITSDFGPADYWLGLNSPIHEIVTSGIWNRQGLNGQPLNEEEVERVKWLTRFGNDRGVPLIKRVHRKRTSEPIQKRMPQQANKKTADDIREYIDQLFQEVRQSGDEYIDLVSGQIHKELGMKNSMPQVCRIMYEKMKAGDKVLHTTPSGMSSTIKIRYCMNK